MTLANEEEALALGEATSLLCVRDHYATLRPTHNVRDAWLDQR